MRCFSFFLLNLGLAFASSLKADKRPNVLLILADDMGYSDLSCMGDPVIQTPTLDNLAERGVLFTQFYNGARSCPSRASLLTGLYAHQAGIGNMVEDLGQPGYQGDLNAHCVTIAEVLKTSGYSTYAVGKWHVTGKLSEEENGNWPLQRGFDHFYGTILGAGSYYEPSGLCRQNHYISPGDDHCYKPEHYYYTDAIGDNALLFLKKHEQRKENQPFFMYMAFTAPHWPMHAQENDIAPYKGQFDEGWDLLRAKKEKKMKDLGLLPSGFIGMWRDSSVPLWINESDKEWESRNMEVYAAMISSMDRNIKKVVDFLKENDRFDNTLILFLSDNGGCAEGYGRAKQAQVVKKPDNTGYRNIGTTIPTIKAFGPTYATWPYQTRDGRPVHVGRGVMSGSDSTYIAIGAGWANYSNTPYTLYKHYIHEGGISTPLIVSWPAGIKKRGEKRRQAGHIIDIMATVLDVCNAIYPKYYKGNVITPLEGISLKPFFNSELTVERKLYWEHGSKAGIRNGDWKLVRQSPRGCGWGQLKDFAPWELYNICEDRTELHDLSGSYPYLVEELKLEWEKWAERCMVKPYPVIKRNNNK